MDNLQTMLLDSHPYIGHYRYAYELIREKPVEEQEISIRLHCKGTSRVVLSKF